LRHVVAKTATILVIMDAFHGSLFELRLTLSCPRHESGAWNDHRAFAVEIVSFLSLGMRSSTVPSRVFQPGHVTVVLGEAQRALPAMGCAGQHCTSSSISRPAAKMIIPRRISASGVFSTGVRRFILASVIRRPRHQGWLSQTRHSPEGRSMATGISPPATALLTARRRDDGSIELHRMINWSGVRAD